MASRLTRYTQLLFGSSASANQMAEFGSFANSYPTVPTRYSGSTITPTIIQTLAQFLDGWSSAVIAGNAPAIEDMNSLFFLCFYQLYYVLQLGIPEWDSGTTYYIGSIVQDGSGNQFVSLTNTNLNNLITDATNWKPQGAGVVTVTASTALTSVNNVVRSNSTSGSLTQTLPAVASCFIGQKITIKDVGTGGNTTSVKGHSAELIDGNNTYFSTLSEYDSLTVMNNGTSWDVI